MTGDCTRAVRTRRRVLIIDDEVLLIRSFSRVLGSDHTVTAVASAAEALRLIATGESWDVILCDVHMPVMDGVEFHARLSRVSPTLLSRLAFVTGGVFTPRAEAFMRSNSVPTLYKPVMPDVLRAFVEEMAQRGEAHPTSQGR